MLSFNCHFRDIWEHPMHVTFQDISHTIQPVLSQRSHAMSHPWISSGALA